ncbi:MAG: serine/threonine protein kinase, partial [Proteobacteria bacterium]|nr:serine/threonine protein kinase [Pseudomonadota bacterium]
MAQEQRFELISTLGKGGMAEVFLGWMNSIGGLRRKVAIKRILPELIQKQSKRFQQMFVDEARLAFQLEHDNVVRVYDVGQSANTFFIVMEYIEGFDLKTILEKLRESGTIFPLSVALYITLQVCSGLGYAHSLTDAEGRPLGLIHNDISPPNILIGRHGEVKVADFGLSDARSNAVSTPDGMIKGKFAYISPECTHNPPQ